MIADKYSVKVLHAVLLFTDPNDAYGDIVAKHCIPIIIILA